MYLRSDSLSLSPFYFSLKKACHIISVKHYKPNIISSFQGHSHKIILVCKAADQQNKRCEFNMELSVAAREKAWV